jgi:ATP-dependent Lon protease
MASTRLPVLPLPHPLILLPTARLTIPISRTLADSLLAILDDSEAGQPVLAAIPVPVPTEPNTNDVANINVLLEAPTTANTPPTHGVAARVVRLVRPRTLASPGSPRQPYLLSLHGLTRIRLVQALDLDPATFDSLPQHAVTYPATDTTPSRETIDAFKDAALRLLDRLAKDSVQTQRKDDWLKVASMVEDLSDQRAAWMSDVLVAAVTGQYADKLGEYIVFLFSEREGENAVTTSANAPPLSSVLHARKRISGGYRCRRPSSACNRTFHQAIVYIRSLEEDCKRC